MRGHWAALALTAMAAQAAAQEGPTGVGALEYAQACAACHGSEGRGDGPFTKYLSVEVPDLTKLAARNGGSFPFDTVMKTIDGRGVRDAHGTPMPIWGDRFTVEAEEIMPPFDRQVVVYGRILALTLYLESIQESL